ncbi:hypothetical protein [Occultella aeris]|uniref:hypothetical protein n=1 Tax=Occultella aeris TaxID=2761496 RepID=UPI0012EA8AF7|nr:hypothetical protein [Occultella aeris]
MSLLSIVLVAWVGVGVGLIVSGHRSVGTAVLAASLALLMVARDDTGGLAVPDRNTPGPGDQGTRH